MVIQGHHFSLTHRPRLQPSAICISPMSAGFPGSVLLFISLASGATIYLILDVVSHRSSPVPLLVSVLIASNMLFRTAIFRQLVRSSQLALARKPWMLLWKLQSPLKISGYSAFEVLPSSSQWELLLAIKSLEDYCTNSRKINDRRRSLFRLMSWRQQKLCDEAGYSQKLRRIDAGISQNQIVFTAIADVAKRKYGLSYRELNFSSHNYASKTTSSSNYRVVESMGHFLRDWVDSVETAHIVDYVSSQLDAVIPAGQVEETCIIVPGSGLGRVAHEIANHKPYGAVYAVEFSGLMHCCNQFVYEKSDKESHTLVPYVNSTSNFLTADAQFREVTFTTGVAKPGNLHLHLDDFCSFEVPGDRNFQNVVVVSVFFIDTAENILEYFDRINQLCAPSRHSRTKNGFWINAGPLKYGSAAQAELNGEEIAHIRKQMGWIDVETDITLDNNNLFPYITDRQSLWQGFYGILKWCNAHRDNNNKLR